MDGMLYFNESNYNVARKSLVSRSGNLTLHFKNESEVVNPTIYLSRSQDVLDANYIYVEDLKRFYYINEITLESQRYILKCHVDVLMSFYTQLLDQRCIIERNAKDGNLYLEDPKLKCFAKTRFETFPWLDNNGQPKGFRVGGSKVKNFILTVSGSGETTPTPNQGGE